MDRADFKNIILFLAIICIFSFDVAACKLFTIESFTVGNDIELNKLKKKFRFNKIKHISIYDDNITSIEKLISILNKNKKGVESISLVTEKLDNRYQILTKLKLKHISISILNLNNDIVEYPNWISDFRVESLSIHCGTSFGLSSINFSNMKELKLLDVGSDSISMDDLNSMASLSQLNSLLISTYSKLDYSSLLNNMQNLKFLSLDISNTPINAFTSFSDISLSIQNADTNTFKKLEQLCNLGSISIYTSVEINVFEKMANELNCYPSLMYYEKNKNWTPIKEKQ